MLAKDDKVGYMNKNDYCCVTYTTFIYCLKKDNLDVKIGFSVQVQQVLTHCVCTHHQNTILLLSAIKWNVTYKVLMEKIVCDTLRMSAWFRDCPGTEALRNYLDQQLEGIDVDEEFHFNQWKSSDRSQLITQTVTVDDYKDQVIESINLKDLKINLKDNECIVLGDFAENYEFVVQDEIPSYHWSKDSCTLHPVVVYFKIEGEQEIQHKSFCFLSDDRNHDMFCLRSAEAPDFLHKRKYESITKEYYFSDGCGHNIKTIKTF